MDTVETNVSHKSAAGQGNLFWSLMCLSLFGMTAGLVLSTPSNLLVLLFLVGWLAALVAVFVSLATRQQLGSRLLRTLAAALIFAAYTGVLVRTVRLVVAQMGSYGALTGIAVGLEQYCEEHGEYPPSLAAMIRGGIQRPQTLISDFETESVVDLNRVDPVHSSFVYQPGKGNWRPDEKVILVYESGTGPSIDFSAEYGPRLVLFADLHRVTLSPEDFSRAMLEDARRRIEIGWPMYSVRPVGEDPQAATQPASRPSTTAAD